MAMASTVTSPPATSTGSGLPPYHNKASSAPPSTAAPGNQTSSSAATTAAGTTEHVAECTYEFLLAAILQWVERDEIRVAEESNRVRMAMQKINIGGNRHQFDSSRASQENGGEEDDGDAAAAVMAAERSAARIERMGYDVGYRLCERLAQHRPLLGPGSPSPESGATDAATSSFGLSNESGGGDNNPIIMGGGGHNTIMDPKSKKAFLLGYSCIFLHHSLLH